MVNVIQFIGTRVLPILACNHAGAKQPLPLVTHRVIRFAELGRLLDGGQRGMRRDEKRNLIRRWMLVRAMCVPCHAGVACRIVS
jgi:hypothetical protein